MGIWEGGWIGLKQIPGTAGRLFAHLCGPDLLFSPVVRANAGAICSPTPVSKAHLSVVGMASGTITPLALIWQWELDETGIGAATWPAFDFSRGGGPQVSDSLGFDFDS